MPDLSPLNLIPVPTGPEANFAPAAIDALVDVIDSRLVGRAASESARNAQYGTAPVGTVVVSTAATREVWVKTGTGSTAWSTIASTISTFAGVFTAATNFSVTEQYGYRSGDLAFVSVSLAYSGPDITAGATGNLPDTTAGSFASGWTPNGGDWYGAFFCTLTGGTYSIDTGGLLVLRTAHGGSVIGSGDTVRVAATYRAN